MKIFFKHNGLVIFKTTEVYSAQIIKFLRSKKLNSLEAKMRMSSLRIDKINTKDSMRLALFGVEQIRKLKPKHYMAFLYEPLRILSISFKS